MSRLRIGILGATGYGGGELLRLLTQHPHAQVVSLVSRTAAGQPVATRHPHLAGFYQAEFAAELDWNALRDGERAVIFAALPHGESATALHTLDEQLRHAGDSSTRIIDLSGDFRLRDPHTHQHWYPESPLHADLRARFVYGLPELQPDDLPGATRIANPGCLATAATLAAAPLARLPRTFRLALDTKTGSSGSGRTLKEATHHPTRHADLRAYGALAHRHEPEIRQTLQAAGWQDVDTTFIAHSMDTTRGIFATVHALADQSLDPAAVRDAYRQAYADCPFVRVVDTTPTLQNVVGSNFVEISVAVRDHQVIAMATLDNLVKGMAGAAIQNMNISCDLPETTGLWQPALRPI